MKVVATAIVVGTLLVTVGVTALLGLPAGLLALAGGALCGVISLAWASLEKLGGAGDLTLDEALALAAPTAAEEQKRAVLRTLKDLEYELSVGKISREDFEQTSAHFRAEAKRLIAEADASLGVRLEQAEARIQKHLAQVEAGAEDKPAKRKARSKRK